MVIRPEKWLRIQFLVMCRLKEKGKALTRSLKERSLKRKSINKVTTYHSTCIFFHAGIISMKLLFIVRFLSVLPNVRIPQREERRLPRQCNSQKKGSSLLTRARAPAAHPTQW